MAVLPFLFDDLEALIPNGRSSVAIQVQTVFTKTISFVFIHQRNNQGQSVISHQCPMTQPSCKRTSECNQQQPKNEVDASPREVHLGRVWNPTDF